MDPADAFSAGLIRWDPRQSAALGFYGGGGRGGGGGGGGVARELEEMFQAYGVRYMTVEKIGELGFTASTLVGMRDDELDDMMETICHVFRWELLVGERYGIKAAVRAERRRIEFLQQQAEGIRRASSGQFFVGDHTILDALSQEGLSEEPVVQQEREVVGSGGEVGRAQKQLDKSKQQQRRGSTSGRNKQQKNLKKVALDDDEEEDDEDDDEDDGRSRSGGGGERQREHPFIVTEPGEVARGKKNGLDYLFHLYNQCRDFLVQVQAIAKERGEKCPTKVTNQVFRFAKRAGASYINKPKMRHYVHCYALHCLDEEASNALRRAFKERGENVGAWRQACYSPLVLIASRHAWDIDAVFAAHPRLAVWYVPTKLRQLCHLARSNAAAASASGGGAAPSLAGHHAPGGLPALF